MAANKKAFRWTQEDIEAYRRTVEKIAGTGDKIKLPAKKKRKPKLLKEIEIFLTAQGIPFELEYRFMDSRKFRFDVAIVEHKIAIEYEGLFSEKSRHTTHGGYMRDMVKYNEATMRGWRILRYSADKEQHKGWSSHIISLINNHDKA